MEIKIAWEEERNEKVHKNAQLNCLLSHGDKQAYKNTNINDIKTKKISDSHHTLTFHSRNDSLL